MFIMQSPGSARIGIIGLGCVSAPLAVKFGRSLDTLGIDISRARIDALRSVSVGEGVHNFVQWYLAYHARRVAAE